MPLLINLRHLKQETLERQGELLPEELDLDLLDEVIRVKGPLRYSIQVQLMEQSILVQGALKVELECDCVRCLHSFTLEVGLSNWSRLLRLEGEDRVQVRNDCVDLTPVMREDILLEFPQHPLCKNDCGGLRSSLMKHESQSDGKTSASGVSSAWAELNKLKL